MQFPEKRVAYHLNGSLQHYVTLEWPLTRSVDIDCSSDAGLMVHMIAVFELPPRAFLRILVSRESR